MKAGRPFSLVRRIIALSVGVSVSAFLLHSAFLVAFLQPLGDELARLLLTQVQTIRRTLQAVPADQRDKLAAAMGSDNLVVSRVSPVRAEVDGTDSGMLPMPLLDRLRASLGAEGVSFIATESGGQVTLSVSMPVGGEMWWMSLPAVRPSLIWPLLPLLSSVMLIALAAVLALVLGVRLFTRPMSKLADDMLERRYELRPIDEPSRVSIELQGVIRSFNSLVHAVQLSSQSRSNLLAGISHDLRTPLARLKLRAETECSEEVSRRMEPDFIALGRIIDQFLAYAQGQNGVTAGAMHRLDDLVEAVVAQYRADGADVTLLRTEDGDLMVPDIGAQRMLTNLLDNALSYGRAPVEVELSGNGADVSIVVYDHGRGIAQCDVERAMQPFVRLDASRGQDGHCGLGLAIVAQVAEQLGGRTVPRPFDGRRSGMGVALPVRSRAGGVGTAGAR